MAMRPPTSPTTVMGGFSLGINTGNKENVIEIEKETCCVKQQQHVFFFFFSWIEQNRIFCYRTCWFQGLSLLVCVHHYMVSPCWGEWLQWSWRWVGSVGRLPGQTQRPELHRGSLLYPDAAVQQMTELWRPGPKKELSFSTMTSSNLGNVQCMLLHKCNFWH